MIIPNAEQGTMQQAAAWVVAREVNLYIFIAKGNDPWGVKHLKHQDDHWNITSNDSKM